MPLVELERQRRTVSRQAIWKAALPFVDNERATLVHRIRYGSTYHIHKRPHIAVQFWCGMSVTASDGHLHFLATPPDGKILCERCEAAAIKAGLQTSDEIAGRHVHKGRTAAVVTCCEAAIRARKS